MDAPEAANHWADPALWVAVSALFISAIQAYRSIRSEAKTRRAVQFIELIAGEFAKCEASLDLLESKLRKAIVNPSITSEDILDVALPAGRTSGRSMRTVSDMPAVKTDMISTTCVDQLDEIWQMASDDSFADASRTLSLKTALNIVTRASSNLASAKSELIAKHL